MPGNWPGANEDGTPLIPVVWRVVPDPPPEAIALPLNRVVHLAIPPGPNPEVLFPATPSTMVSIGNVGHGLLDWSRAGDGRWRWGRFFGFDP